MENLYEDNQKFIITGKQLNVLFFNTFWGVTNFKKFVETLQEI